MSRVSAFAALGACLLVAVTPVSAVADQRATSPVGRLLTVPYVTQPPKLCGGAALSMVLRYWGARNVFPADFAALVDEAEGGIRASALAQAATDRGWLAVPSAGADGDLSELEREVRKGRPLIVLIEDGVTRYHYVVVAGFTPTGVILHDPARAPFRVVARDRFLREWNAAGRWFMLVLPGANPVDRVASNDSVTYKSPDAAPAHSACGSLIQEHVLSARKGDMDAAEAGLRAATELCPSDPAAWRELAGLRFVQQRYRDAIKLAKRATVLDANDQATNELLAGARFLAGDLTGALEAWNRLDEPRVDLVTVDGLRRTSHAVAVDRLALEPRQLLTASVFVRAERRAAELPTLGSTELTYQPSVEGTAGLTLRANEGRLMPRSFSAWSLVGLTTLLRREVRLDLPSPLGEGEMWTFAYRFADRRPRGQFRIALPSRGGLPGVTAIEAIWEGQSYESLSPNNTAVDVSRRRLRAGLSDWAAAWFKWEAGVALDRFDGIDRFVAVDSRIVVRSISDLVSTTAAFSRWLPVTSSTRGFSTASISAGFQ
jgi:predicted double-glycine peptidase